jgi:DNA-nicking Smr family endonuclease
MDNKPSKPSALYRPFANLKALLEKKSFTLSSNRKEKPAKIVSDKTLDTDTEAGLFQRAMTGIEPIISQIATIDKSQRSSTRVSKYDPDAEALARLEDLVKNGDGLIISNTPEYMEGVGYGVNPDVARRLHQGDFSIQAHVDLHGFSVENAQETFERFLKEALLSGKTAVLVIHGRGLSSREEPVLKTKVKEWLTSGPWRKWVIAFTSARACDGGTGATYILLRRRPATKRYRRRYRKTPVGRRSQ